MGNFFVEVQVKVGNGTAWEKMHPFGKEREPYVFDSYIEAEKTMYNCYLGWEHRDKVRVVEE